MLSRITDCFDVKIFIKEYYIQPYRDINFWNDVKKLKNVELISSSVSSNELIKHCIAVASQTGTSLMEAIFERKPALAFGGGHNWKGMPGLIEIENEIQGRNEIRKILQGFSVDLADIKRYFYCIQENSIEYYIKRDYTVEKNEAYEKTLNDLKRIIENTIDEIHQ